MPRPLRLLTERIGDPARETAVARALLRRVAAGEIADTFRLTTPGRVMAFGRQDTVRPGYGAAIEASAGLGFTPIERLAGGRAAVFHEGTLAFSWATADEEPVARIHERFRELAGIMATAFERLGVDVNNGFGDLVAKLAELPDVAEKAELVDAPGAARQDEDSPQGS